MIQEHLMTSQNVHGHYVHVTQSTGYHTILTFLIPLLFPEHCNICTVHRTVDQCITLLVAVRIYICDVAIPGRQRDLTWEKSI